MKVRDMKTKHGVEYNPESFNISLFFKEVKRRKLEKECKKSKKKGGHTT